MIPPTTGRREDVGTRENVAIYSAQYGHLRCHPWVCILHEKKVHHNECEYPIVWQVRSDCQKGNINMTEDFAQVLTIEAKFAVPKVVTFLSFTAHTNESDSYNMP
jgi:hypothetical protein